MGKKVTGIELFCGVGGMSLGAKAAGVSSLLAVDLSQTSVNTHKQNLPQNSVIQGDVSKLSATEIRKLAGLGRREAVDILFGGPPCQGFSSIGKRNVRDRRNSLLCEFARYAEILRPRFVVIENVSGLLHPHGRSHLIRLNLEFEQLGYHLADMQVLDAANFEVPQRRRRVFIVFAKKRDSHFLLPFSAGRAHLVRDAIGDLPISKKKKHLYECDTLNWSSREKEISGYTKYLDEIFPRQNPLSQEKDFILSGCLLTKHADDVIQRMIRTKQGQREPISRAQKLRVRGYSPTLRAGTDVERGSFTAVRPIHPFQARCITVREGARLHSFPDWFEFHPSRWHGFRQVGNAVPPLLAFHVFSQLLESF